MDWVNEGKTILGYKGNLGINGFVDGLAAESKNEVTAYRVESDIGIIVVCNWETEGLMWDNKWANLIASSMSLISVTLILSIWLWDSDLSDFIFAEIIFCFAFKKEVKTGSKYLLNQFQI